MTAGAQRAREVWLLMSDLVLDNTRRREVSEALGIDRPNATVLVDDLEAHGLARRRDHPTDRRAKLVGATHRGKALARRADDILATPPEALTELGEAELETLHELLARVRAG